MCIVSYASVCVVGERAEIKTISNPQKKRELLGRKNIYANRLWEYLRDAGGGR